jgi:[acyl-carrier-protein] S-malonyltransferase
MEEPAKRFAEALAHIEFQPGSTKVYSNVTAEPAMDGERWMKLLEEQLRSPVLWTQSVQEMIRDGVDTFIECGPGDVLSGLIRRIDKEVKTANASTYQS